MATTKPAGDAIALLKADHRKVEGLFDKFNCDTVYGMHNMPGIPAGRFAILSGPMLAASDSWQVKFKGTGGHGALPHQGTDPTFVAGQLIVAERMLY